MTTDEGTQYCEQVREVFQSEPRENYNKVVFRKPITIAIPVNNRQDVESSSTCSGSMSSCDLASWRAQQEAQREYIRQLDHTPPPPQRPPKKPHLRLGPQGITLCRAQGITPGRAQGITPWKSTCDLQNQSQVEARINHQTGHKMKSKTHSDLFSSKSMGAFDATSVIAQNNNDDSVVTSDTTQKDPSFHSDTNVVISSQNDGYLAIGNVAYKRNLFAPKPFTLNNERLHFTGENSTISLSKTFPSLNKFLTRDEKTNGIPGGSLVKPNPSMGSKPVVAPKPNLKTISLKQQQLEARKDPSLVNENLPKLEQFCTQETLPNSTALSSQSRKSPILENPTTKITTTMQSSEIEISMNGIIGKNWKHKGGKGGSVEIEMSKTYEGIEEIKNGQPGTSSGKIYQDKRATIYYPSSNDNCNSCYDTNFHNNSTFSPPNELRSPSQVSPHKLKNIGKEREYLLRRLSLKVSLLKKEKEEVKKKINLNEEIGRKLIENIRCVGQMAEVDKLSTHIAEMDKMTSLLISLQGRLARTEIDISSMEDDADTDEKKSLRHKQEKLLDQLEEAKQLRSMKEKMADKVLIMLQKYLTTGELEEYHDFVNFKVRLIIEAKEIDDKMKLGEEQMEKLEDSSEHVSLAGPITSL